MVPMIPCVNTGHGYQHRPQLQQNYRPRRGSQQQLGLDITMALMAAQDTQISMALETVWPVDTNVVSGG